MQSANDLKQLLFGINHKSYPAYKSTRGAYQFPRYTLSIDHVQGDPFAAPSRVSVHINGKTAAFPTSLYDTYEKRVALQDYLLRQFARAIAPYSVSYTHLDVYKRQILVLQQIFINFLPAVQFDRICFRRICADRLAEADVIKESGNVDITGFVPECRDKFAVGRDARFVKVAERQVQKLSLIHIFSFYVISKKSSLFDLTRF